MQHNTTPYNRPRHNTTKHTTTQHITTQHDITLNNIYICLTTSVFHLDTHPLFLLFYVFAHFVVVNYWCTTGYAGRHISFHFTIETGNI